MSEEVKMLEADFLEYLERVYGPNALSRFTEGEVFELQKIYVAGYSRAVANILAVLEEGPEAFQDYIVKLSEELNQFRFAVSLHQGPDKSASN